MEEREEREWGEVKYRIFLQSYTDQNVDNKFQEERWASRKRSLEHLVVRLLFPL